MHAIGHRLKKCQKSKSVGVNQQGHGYWINYIKNYIDNTYENVNIHILRTCLLTARLTGLCTPQVRRDADTEGRGIVVGEEVGNALTGRSGGGNGERGRRYGGA